MHLQNLHQFKEEYCTEYGMANYQLKTEVFVSPDNLALLNLINKWLKENPSCYFHSAVPLTTQGVQDPGFATNRHPITTSVMIFYYEYYEPVTDEVAT